MRLSVEMVRSSALPRVSSAVNAASKLPHYSSAKKSSRLGRSSTGTDGSSSLPGYSSTEPIHYQETTQSDTPATRRRKQRVRDKISTFLRYYALFMKKVKHFIFGHELCECRRIFTISWVAWWRSG